MRHRRGGTGKPKQTPPAPSKCRDCGEARTIPRYEFFRAARPRCLKCGGLMEYTGGWQGATDRPRPQKPLPGPAPATPYTPGVSYYARQLEANQKRGA